MASPKHFTSVLEVLIVKTVAFVFTIISVDRAEQVPVSVTLKVYVPAVAVIYGLEAGLNAPPLEIE